MTTLDLAWAAGIIEGEGYISTNGRGHGPYIEVQMTDPDVIQRLQAVLGGHVVERDRHRGHKQIYRWRLYGARAAGALMTVYTFLGQRRRAKARLVLNRWRTKTA